MNRFLPLWRKVIKVREFYIMLWTLNGFCHPQKMSGLGWTDGLSPVSSCGSCSGSAPHPRPPPPALSSLRVCPDQTPMLLSTQLTLLLQPFIDLPLPSPPIPPMFRKQLQVLREQASLPSAPITLSSSSPHLLGNPLCWLCGGPFSPLSVYT